MMLNFIIASIRSTVMESVMYLVPITKRPADSAGHHLRANSGIWGVPIMDKIKLAEQIGDLSYAQTCSVYHTLPATPAAR
jgi:hypothetical protein